MNDQPTTNKREAPSQPSAINYPPSTNLPSPDWLTQRPKDPKFL